MPPAALLVGIERYDASSDWTLDGPARDVFNVAERLLRSGVQSTDIRVLLSTEDTPKGRDTRDKIQLLLGRPAREARFTEVIEEVKALQERHRHADPFLLYWSGHGWISARHDRSLYVADATLRDYSNIDLKSLLGSMQTDWYSGLPNQVFIVDACATFEPPGAQHASSHRFGGGEALTATSQIALFASSAGEAARNLGLEQGGLFTRELLLEWDALPVGTWPDFAAIADRLSRRFEQLKAAGKAQQTPATLWYRDRTTERESFFASETSPLIDLQSLMARYSESAGYFAKVWYARSLRRVPALTALDRDAGDRGIAELLAELDEWGQLPSGDLPVATFALGIAERTHLKDNEKDRTQAKRLIKDFAMKKGLDEEAYTEARQCAIAELERAPAALQICFVSERDDLDPDDPRVTFTVTVHTWEGDESGPGGASAIYGRAESASIDRAKAFVHDSIGPLLADPAPALVEMFLPYRLLSSDVELWPVRKGRWGSSPIGLELPVVLRCIERVAIKEIRKHWQTSWPIGADGSQAANVRVKWMADPPPAYQALYAELRMQGAAPCLLFGASATQIADGVWRASIEAGVAIALWVRPGPAAGYQLLLELANVLSDRPHPLETCTVDEVKALPSRILAHRMNAAAATGTAMPVCLLWDDPHRIPRLPRSVEPAT